MRIIAALLLLAVLAAAGYAYVHVAKTDALVDPAPEQPRSSLSRSSPFAPDMPLAARLVIGRYLAAFESAAEMRGAQLCLRLPRLADGRIKFGPQNVKAGNFIFGTPYGEVRFDTVTDLGPGEVLVAVKRPDTPFAACDASLPATPATPTVVPRRNENYPSSYIEPPKDPLPVGRPVIGSEMKRLYREAEAALIKRRMVTKDGVTCVPFERLAGGGVRFGHWILRRDEDFISDDVGLVLVSRARGSGPGMAWAAAMSDNDHFRPQSDCDLPTPAPFPVADASYAGAIAGFGYSDVFSTDQRQLAYVDLVVNDILVRVERLPDGSHEFERRQPTRAKSVLLEDGRLYLDEIPDQGPGFYWVPLVPQMPQTARNPIGVPAALTADFRGCFALDAASRPDAGRLPGRPKTSELTVGRCVDFCRGQGMAYASLERGTACRCDTAMPFSGTPGGLCKAGCPASSAEVCGGIEAASVFAVSP